MKETFELIEIPVNQKEQPTNNSQVASIVLEGEPYQRVVDGEYDPEIVDCSKSLDILANQSGYSERLGDNIAEVEPILTSFFENGGYYYVDSKLKHGQDLTFEESFGMITYVLSVLNKPLKENLDERYGLVDSEETHLLQATALLSAMSAKEGYVGLTAEEIAGMVAATLHLDTVARPHLPDAVLSFGGMGGDRGYPTNGENSKLFSLSTLSAVALSSLVPVHKHHSYPNTSKVAGQSAIEAYGARSDFHSYEAMENVFTESGLLMTSCHNTRTLHTLSHRLRGETINHVIGPLSFTVSPETIVNAYIGVNEKIHPETIIESLLILGQKGFQKYDNCGVYFGTDLEEADPQMFHPEIYSLSNECKRHIAIDEVAPPPYVTMAAFAANGESLGTYALYPEDFYEKEDLSIIDADELRIPNTRDAILQANDAALSGSDESKSRYLAMTMGLALFIRECLDRPDALDVAERRVNREYLRECTRKSLEILKSGAATNKLAEYVKITKKYSGRKI